MDTPTSKQEVSSRKILRLTPEQEQRYAVEPPRMTILSDHPILRDEEDESKQERDFFGLASRLASIYDILRHRNTRTPIAIAIYGDWGTGKSSAMRWLASQLATWNKDGDFTKGDKKLRTVWFDPWKFHDREDVWRGLIAEVILNTIDVKNASLATVTNAAKQFGLFLGRSFLNVLSNVKLKAGAKRLGGEVELNLDALKKIAEDYHQTAHPERAFLNDFEATLKRWLKDSLKANERLVVFIDDLDRCLPGVTFEVLEALKLYLNIDRLIFVVGLDRHVVQAHVEKHYEQIGLPKNKARHYLAKMFQVEIDIPPSQTLIEEYLPAQIEALDEICDRYWSNNLEGWKPEYKKIIEKTIGGLAEHNPREIKRLLNSTLFRATAAARNESLGGNEPQRFTQGAQVFLVQAVLRAFFPDTDGLLRLEKAQVFFETWSRLVQKHPDFRWSDGLFQTDPRELTKVQFEFTDFFSDTPSIGPMQCSLHNNDHLWELMKIPFSSAVAAATSVSQNDSKPPKQPESGVLAESPPAMLSAIANALQKPIDQILPDDLLAVTELDLSRTQVSNVTPLGALKNIEILYLMGTQVCDVTPLAELKNLRTLELRNTLVRDVTPLGTLQNLRYLNLNETHVSDVTALGPLENLQILYLAGTQVSDVTPLAELKNLEKLNLDETQVSDMTPLGDLMSLRELSLCETQVSDVTPLAELKDLRRIRLSGTQVSDVTPLAEIENLQTLDLTRSQVSDVMPLGKLKNLQILNLAGDQVSDEQVTQLGNAIPDLHVMRDYR